MPSYDPEWRRKITILWIGYNLCRLTAVGATVWLIVGQILELTLGNGAEVFIILARILLLLALLLALSGQLGVPSTLLAQHLPLLGPQSTPLTLGLMQGILSILILALRRTQPPAPAYVLLGIGGLNIFAGVFLLVVARGLPLSTLAGLHFYEKTRLSSFLMPPTAEQLGVAGRISGAGQSGEAEESGRGRRGEASNVQTLDLDPHLFEDKGEKMFNNDPEKHSTAHPVPSKSDAGPGTTTSRPTATTVPRVLGNTSLATLHPTAPPRSVGGSTATSGGFKVLSRPSNLSSRAAAEPRSQTAVDRADVRDVRQGGYPTFSGGKVGDPTAQVPPSEVQFGPDGEIRGMRQPTRGVPFVSAPPLSLSGPTITRMSSSVPAVTFAPRGERTHDDGSQDTKRTKRTKGVSQRKTAPPTKLRVVNPSPSASSATTTTSRKLEVTSPSTSVPTTPFSPTRVGMAR